MASTSQQMQSAHTPSSDCHSMDGNPLWEDDEMFNIYIWDYCTKRGYINTARELIEEARIKPGAQPPINAKQGLLYEWWSVFWVLFTAKNKNTGPDDALLYTQHQQARMQSALSRFPQNGMRPGMPSVAPTAPGIVGAGIPSVGTAAATQPLPGQSHILNNGHPMPNGIMHGPPAAGQHPQHLQQSNQQPQHGQADQTQGQGQQGQQQGRPQLSQATSLGFTPHPPPSQSNGIPQGVRPTMPGQVPRNPSGSMHGPFHSPTMAHTGPPNAGLQTPYTALGAQTHMGSLPVGMYNHVRPMMPPGSVPGNGGIQNGIPSANSPGFVQQPGARAGSRTPTPAQGASSGPGLTQRSPSLAHRAVPQTPPSFGGVAPTQGLQMPGSGGRGPGPHFDPLTGDLQKIDPQLLNELKVEHNLTGKDITVMSKDEKSRLLSLARQRSAAATSVQASQTTRNQTRGKRNSVSPRDEPPDLKSESSPPANKRARHSPDQSAQSNASGPSTAIASQGSAQSSNANSIGGMLPPGSMQRPPPFSAPMSAMSASGVMHPGLNPQQMTQQLATQLQAKAQAYPQVRPGEGPPTPFGPDPSQPRSAPPLFAPGGASVSNAVRAGPAHQTQPQQKTNNMMLPPSSPATNAAIKPQQLQAQPAQPLQAQNAKSDVKTESSPRGNAQSQPPSSSGSVVSSGGRSPSAPAGGAQQAQSQTSAPSPSLNNISRPPNLTSDPSASTQQAAPASSSTAPSQASNMGSSSSLDALATTSFPEFIGQNFEDLIFPEDDFFSNNPSLSWFSDIGMLDSSK